VSQEAAELIELLQAPKDGVGLGRGGEDGHGREYKLINDYSLIALTSPT
jgi:hypothetical protein